MDTTPLSMEEIIKRSVLGGDSPPPEPADDDRVDMEEAGLSDEQRRQRWLSRRPRIDHLKDAIVEVEAAEGTGTERVPLFDVGDRIVVDVCTSWLRGNPWIYTIVGKVRSIDDETGLVTMWDEDSDRYCPKLRYVNFKGEHSHLRTFKLAPAHGNPFTITAIRQASRPEPKPGDPPKRGRGRPKGSKNRPKEVIQAEREAYKKMMEERRKHRGKR